MTHGWELLVPVALFAVTAGLSRKFHVPLLAAGLLAAATPLAVACVRQAPDFSAGLYVTALDKKTPMLLFMRFMSMLRDLGLYTVFPLSLLLLGNRRRLRENLLLAAMALVASLFGLLMLKWGYSPARAAATVLALTAAQAGIEHLLVRPWKGTENDRLLILWFVIGFIVVLFIDPGVPPLLPVLPAWIIQYMRRAQAGPSARWLPVTIAATLAFALAAP